MARENQGLQIALIIFVMLTVVLGVTTFIFFQKCEEANKKALESDATAKTANEEKRAADERFAVLRRLIGHPDSAQVDAIETKFQDDMKEYAANFSEEARTYSAVLPFLYKTIDDAEGDLATKKEEVQTLKDQLAVVQNNAKPQVENHVKSAEAAKEDLAKVNADYKTRRASFLRDQQQLQGQWAKTRKDATIQAAQFEEQLQTASVRLQKLAKINEAKSEKLQAFQTETFEVPDGEIRWVNQGNGTVWINLGRSDNLQRQTTFSVYPRDSSNLTGSVKKASIEVTQLLGPHTAEARIVQDSMTNPIMPGDKIHTPIWSRGEQRRFALAGLIDLNGNGKSDQNTVRNLITMNGGTIDAWTDESGRVQGKMTANTRYLVLGKAPDERSTDVQRNGYSKMIGEAATYHIEQISLSELLNKMGWRNQTQVSTFGRGGSVRAAPSGALNRTSTGNVSELFKKKSGAVRAPVRRGSAY